MGIFLTVLAASAYLFFGIVACFLAFGALEFLSFKANNWHIPIYSLVFIGWPITLPLLFIALFFVMIWWMIRDERKRHERSRH